DQRGLPACKRGVPAVSLQLGATVEHLEAGRALGGAGIDVVLAGAEDLHDAARRHDLYAVGVRKPAQPDVELALREGARCFVVAEIGDVELARRTDAERHRAHLYLRAAAVLRRNREAGGDGIIEIGLGPIVFVGRALLHSAFNGAQAPDATGRIRRLRLRPQV